METDPSFNNYLQEKPLINFSLYTSLQVDTIVEFGKKITDQFDSTISLPNRVDMSSPDIYGQVWLWVIGTYEIIRTMAEPNFKNSWNEDTYSRINDYKMKLSGLRVPFAKQQLRRKPDAVQHECSIYSIDFENKSYIYMAEGKTYNIRTMINEFNELIKSITTEDIHHDLRENALSKRRQ